MGPEISDNVFSSLPVNSISSAAYNSEGMSKSPREKVMFVCSRRLTDDVRHVWLLASMTDEEKSAAYRHF